MTQCVKGALGMNLQLVSGIMGFLFSTVLNYPMLVGIYSLWRKSRTGELLNVPVPWDSLSVLYFAGTLLVKLWGVYTLFFQELPRIVMGGMNSILAVFLIVSILADLIMVWFQSDMYRGDSLVSWIFHWCNQMVRLWESGGWLMLLALVQAAALLVAGFSLVVFSV